MRNLWNLQGTIRMKEKRWLWLILERFFPICFSDSKEVGIWLMTIFKEFFFVNCCLNISSQNLEKNITEKTFSFSWEFGVFIFTSFKKGDSEKKDERPQSLEKDSKGKKNSLFESEKFFWSFYRKQKSLEKAFGRFRRFSKKEIWNIKRFKDKHSFLERISFHSQYHILF